MALTRKKRWKKVASGCLGRGAGGTAVMAFKGCWCSFSHSSGKKAEGPEAGRGGGRGGGEEKALQQQRGCTYPPPGTPFCIAQVASYELGALLPDAEGPNVLPCAGPTPGEDRAAAHSP